MKIFLLFLPILVGHIFSTSSNATTVTETSDLACQTSSSTANDDSENTKNPSMQRIEYQELFSPEELSVIADSAELSAAIYDCKGECKSISLNGQTWNVVLDSRSVGPRITTMLFGEIDPVGFHAAMYQNIQTASTIIVFQGTNATSITDWTTNTVQLTQKPAQFDMASTFAKTAIEQVCKNKSECRSQLTVTGHSLGGGLAQYVATQYSLKAYTFNAAGLGEWADTSLTPTSIASDRADIAHFYSQGFHFGITYGQDWVPKTGDGQVSDTNCQVSIALPLITWDTVTVELATHAIQPLATKLRNIADMMSPQKFGGTWVGTARKGFFKDQVVWEISQNGADLVGSVQISDESSGDIARYNFSGRATGDFIYMQGVNFLERSSDRFCIAAARAQLLQTREGLELDGTWSGLEIPSGCPITSSGKIHLVKKLAAPINVVVSSEQERLDPGDNVPSKDVQNDYIYLATDKGSIYRWNVKGSVEAIVKTGLPLRDIAFNPNGDMFAITSDALYQLDLKSGQATLIGKLLSDFKFYNQKDQLLDADGFDISPAGVGLVTSNDNHMVAKIDLTTGRVKDVSIFSQGGGRQPNGGIWFISESRYVVHHNYFLKYFELKSSELERSGRRVRREREYKSSHGCPGPLAALTVGDKNLPAGTLINFCDKKAYALLPGKVPLGPGITTFSVDGEITGATSLR